jgi:hypothetical protein
MGRQPDYQHKLIITNLNPEKRIRSDHPLRNIQDKIDFVFVYEKVRDTYGKFISLLSRQDAA